MQYFSYKISHNPLMFRNKLKCAANNCDIISIIHGFYSLFHFIPSVSNLFSKLL